MHRVASRPALPWLLWSLALFGCADVVPMSAEQVGPLIFVEPTGQRIGSLTTNGQRGAGVGEAHAVIVSPRWSPSGSMIAYVGLEDDRVRDLWIVNIDAEGRPAEPRSALRWDTAEPPPLLHWLPDESGLLWSEMTDTSVAVRQLELASGADTWHFQINLSDLDVASDGRIVGRASTESSDSLAVHAASFERLFETEAGLGKAPRWSPDGSEVGFVLLGEPGIGVLDPDTGTWERLTNAEDTDLRWSPDGTYLSFVRQREQLVLRDRQRGTETIMLEAEAAAHEWSRDGRHLAMPGPDRTLWLLSRDDGSVREVVGLRASVPNLDWS
ncbi:hypothetical protein DB30_03449 [Enhygromyxa salina]|uniref:Translocation protein TolB n=1 Tax=Enhygromyxa salina TaxID=215803 RepID=A0A0C2D209_9BACT|nr:PD40 domain-containing protein [Enhygromyxa salina]KIG17266.1 hypothetical protein DB30_03449 [Enhygromyxa salina]